MLGTDRYINRELGFLLFNRRVLAEAQNEANPPLERCKFLSITASNLDEFFMIRYASLRARALLGDAHPDPAGLSCAEQLVQIGEEAKCFAQKQANVFDKDIRPVLRVVGYPIISMRELTASQRIWAEGCFRKEVLPKLSIQRIGKQPLSGIMGRALYILLALEAKNAAEALAVVSIPQGIRRAFLMPKALGDGMLFVEEMILGFLELLPSEGKAKDAFAFRVTRDEDFTVADDTTQDLLLETQASLKRRKTGDVVRLEIQEGVKEETAQRLCAALCADSLEIIRIGVPLDFTFLMKEIVQLPGQDALRYPPFVSQMPWPEGADVFQRLRAGDVFLHHPYDSFDAVLQFVQQAAKDPRVLAIKQTLYRVSGQSPAIRALCEAAEAGKHVTVLLELKARFDEENNMLWGKVLERAGCEVIYGLPRLKTHSKITLVVRRERRGLRRYMHLGTGNYNDVTARQYTDMGLLTCDLALGEDAQSFFNMITGFSREPRMKKLIYAPHMLRDSLTALIRAEAENAKEGLPSGILAKMNALVDPGIIEALYEAAGAGVPIRLIVRGACCLRPSLAGLSETVQVHSVVGRFLEHSRAFQFENAGAPLVYLSSADWMPRNLNRRVELMFPVEDEKVREQIMNFLAHQWQDATGSWEMQPDGGYIHMGRGDIATLLST